MYTRTKVHGGFKYKVTNLYIGVSIVPVTVTALQTQYNTYDITTEPLKKLKSRELLLEKMA